MEYNLLIWEYLLLWCFIPQMLYIDYKNNMKFTKIVGYLQTNLNNNRN